MSKIREEKGLPTIHLFYANLHLFFDVLRKLLQRNSNSDLLKITANCNLQKCRVFAVPKYVSEKIIYVHIKSTRHCETNSFFTSCSRFILAKT